MIAPVLDHLLQSTLVAALLAVSVLAFHREPARVRFWIWFAASMKFLLPFAGLVQLGAQLRGRAPVAAGAVYQAMARFSQPLAVTQVPMAAERDWVLPLLVSIWAIGCVALIAWRLREWLQMYVAVAVSAPMDVESSVPVRVSPAVSEPCLAGIRRPVVLVPADLCRQLDATQLALILDHERSHARRRDNLLALLHMVVETLFWFHPTVWWIGRRMLEERERACDEAVLAAGGDRQVYAESLLAICRRKLIPVPVGAATVSSAEMKERVQAILWGEAGRRLSLSRRVLAAALSVMVPAVPLLSGFAQPRALSVRPYFASVHIRPTTYPGEVIDFRWSLGRLESRNVSVAFLLKECYPWDDGEVALANAPDWVFSRRFDITAAPGDAEWVDAAGPVLPGVTAADRNRAGHRMLARILRMLEEHFGLRAHFEDRKRTVSSPELALDWGFGERPRPYPGVLVIDRVTLPQVEAN